MTGEFPYHNIDRAIRDGADRALRTRADKQQRQKPAGGNAVAGDHFPGVMVRSPEAAIAANLAAEFERLADELEAEGAQ